MADLKPTGVKAPLHLIPARSLRHVAACMEHGVITKGAPWNWQVYDDLETRKNEYISAAMRHLICIGDPSESDFDPDSGLNHAGHAIAGLLIYLWLCEEDYRKSKAVQCTAESNREEVDGQRTVSLLPTFSPPTWVGELGSVLYALDLPGTEQEEAVLREEENPHDPEEAGCVGGVPESKVRCGKGRRRAVGKGPKEARGRRVQKAK